MTIIGQDISGYTLSGDTTFFVFREFEYEVSQVERVVVTGSFRNWSQEMDDDTWSLSKTSANTWTLAVENLEF